MCVRMCVCVCVCVCLRARACVCVCEEKSRTRAGSILTRALHSFVPGSYCLFMTTLALAFGGFARAFWFGVCTDRV